MITFPVPTTPFPDESLQGFVARACDGNGHPAVVHALRLAGFDAFHARSLMISESADLAALSTFFGCAEDDLRRRQHLPIDVDGCAPKTFFNYFGSPIRRLFREPTLRRVSPTSLGRSEHHRASWLLRPLKYCSESGEMLVMRCPNPKCGRPLAWRWAFGVSFCESCLDADTNPTTDLRAFEQPKLYGDELEEYRTVAALTTEPRTRGTRIPHYFSSWKGWEIFDLVVLLAIYLAKRFAGRTQMASPTIFELRDWHENFMVAARAVFAWPDGIADVVQLMKQCASSRSGYYGRRKELGPLADFAKHHEAIAKVSTAVHDAIARYYARAERTLPERSYELPRERVRGMISYRVALKRHKISSEFLTSIATHRDIEVVSTGSEKFAPTFFNEYQLAELLRARRQLVPLDRLLSKTGLPTFIFLGLAASKHINLAEGAATRFREAAVYPSEVERMESRIEVNASDKDCSGKISLTKAIQSAGSTGGGLLLWLVQRALDGELKYSLAEGSKSLASRIMLSQDEISKIAPPKHHLPAAPAPETMSRRDVEMYLNLRAEDAAGLVACGLLKNSGPHRLRAICGKSVTDFNAEFLTTTTISRWLKRDSRLIRETMIAQHGIQPAGVFHGSSRRLAYVWNRNLVEAIFADGTVES